MFKNKETIYLDHAASTPLDKEVLSEMIKTYKRFENPSSLYAGGVKSKNILSDCRARVANILKTNSDSIIFTRGGTESINLGIIGFAMANKGNGKHIIVSAIEHAAVLASVKYLESQGFEITYLPVDKNGLVSIKQFSEAIRPDTILVSIMYANNEIGTVEPLADLGRVILKYRKNNNTKYPFFHTDASQATNYLSLDVENLHVDLMSLNSSKIYGPKSAGILYKRRGIIIEPIIRGGGHEMGLRAGTEDIAMAVGITIALEKAVQIKDLEVVRLADLSEYFWCSIKEQISNVVLLGSEVGETRLANNINIAFLGTDSESLILYLDAAGVCVSSGSACSTDSMELSHVLKAIGASEDESISSIRFSFGRGTNKKELDQVLKILKKTVDSVREMKVLEVQK